LACASLIISNATPSLFKAAMAKEESQLTVASASREEVERVHVHNVFVCMCRKEYERQRYVCDE
jgi:hypothetical protein